MQRACMVVLLLVTLDAIAAVPPGYRYVGSRAVSAGRVVLWYWNPDVVEPAGPAAFVAHLYARAVDVDQERPYAAVVRCGDRTYRPVGETGPFLPIDDGEPIAAVWRAGCVNGAVIGAAERRARLDGGAPSMATGNVGAPMAPEPPAATRAAPSAGPPPAPPVASAASAPANAGPTTPSTDPKRSDACVRFSDTRNAAAGDATITNTCRYPIEVSLCYTGATGGPYDCGKPSRGRLADSLGPGVTHVLPEFRRGKHRGIVSIACRGAPGSVFPRLEEPGNSACE